MVIRFKYNIIILYSTLIGDNMRKHAKSKNSTVVEFENTNPVAKHAFKFNKPQVFKDRKNVYSRQAKYKQKESFEIMLWLNNIISKDSCSFCVFS